MKPTDMFVMDFNSKDYLRRPQAYLSKVTFNSWLY